MENNNGYKKNQSRKWRLVLLVVILATVGAFLPPAISSLVTSSPLVVISGTQWVSLITMIVGLYIGGNVYQKHIENKNSHELRLGDSKEG
jgi:hypothetical protein